MTIQEAAKIIDDHSQNFKLSCSPSIIEILLKLERSVDSTYYVQQNTYKDKNVGLEAFKEKTIEGITFHQHDINTEGSFTDRIKKELKEGRFVGIYVQNQDAANTYHGWVILDIQEGNKLILKSKQSELGNREGRQTIERTFLISEAFPPHMNDLVFYTRQSNP